MPKLALLLEQRKAQNSAIRERVALEQQLLDQVARTASEGIAKVDLSPISKAIAALPAAFPKPEKVDLGPVLARIESVSAQLQRCMDMMVAEGNATRNSMPKIPAPEKVDLSGVYADLQWLKSVVALDRKEDVQEVRKTSWNFIVQRDGNGFIKSIKAE